jgi:hypothetical protein
MSSVRNYLALFYCGFSLLFGGCGGTEAGNPTNSETIPTNQPAGILSPYMLDTVCTKLHECSPNVASADCSAGVLPQTNLPAGFGLSTTFGTTQEMIEAERAGIIHADYTHVINCVTAIRALSCASPSINSATPMGSTTSPSSYSGVINMIPNSSTSCAGVF